MLTPVKSFGLTNESNTNIRKTLPQEETEIIKRINFENIETKEKKIVDEIKKLYCNGDYKKNNENFDTYIEVINNLLLSKSDNDISEIVRLDTLTSLFINLSICVFNQETLNKISIFGEKIIKLLEEKGLLKQLVLIKQSIYKNELRENKNAHLDCKQIEEYIEIIQNKGYKSDVLNISDDDIYNYNISKYEFELHKNSSKKSSDFLKFKPMSFQSRTDLEIHFSFLKTLKIKQELDGFGVITNSKISILSILNEEGIINTLRISKNQLLISLELNSNLKNKILLIDTLLLLTEIEEKKEIKEEYFFIAWGHIKEHFGKIDNYYKQKIIQTGEGLFPGLPPEYIERFYEQKKEIGEIKHFIGESVHDLNNPLAVVMGIIQLLGSDLTNILKGLSDDEKIESNHIKEIISRLEKINCRLPIARHQAGRLQNIIKYLSDTCRAIIDKIEIKLYKTMTNIENFINNIVIGQRLYIESINKNIIINVDIPNDIFTSIDSKEFERVIINIISNSIKFIEEKGVINISGKIKNNFLFLEIEDNGIGIEEDQETLVFELGKQAGTKKNKNKGSGIGLAYVKKIVGMHDGSVNIKNKGSGIGTTITIKIPTNCKQNGE